MKTSTMLLLNFILHPSHQSLQVCLLQIRYAYSTKGCWIRFAFIYEQANFCCDIQYRPPCHPAEAPVVECCRRQCTARKKGLFKYSAKQRGSSASRIMDLINKLIRRGAAARCPQIRWNFKITLHYRPPNSNIPLPGCRELCNGKEHSDIPPRSCLPVSQSIMTSSASLLWQLS